MTTMTVSKQKGHDLIEQYPYSREWISRYVEQHGYDAARRVLNCVYGSQGGAGMGLPPRVLRDVSTVEPTDEAWLRTLESVSKIIENENDSGIMVILGSEGSGKTLLGAYLLWMYAESMAGKGEGYDIGQYITMPNLFRRIRGTYDGSGNELQTYQQFLSDWILVIDGIQTCGQWEQRMLRSLLLDRHDNFHHTILCGNLSTQKCADVLGNEVCDRVASNGVLTCLPKRSFRNPE